MKKLFFARHVNAITFCCHGWKRNSRKVIQVWQNVKSSFTLSWKAPIHCSEGFTLRIQKQQQQLCIMVAFPNLQKFKSKQYLDNLEAIQYHLWILFSGGGGGSWFLALLAPLLEYRQSKANVGKFFSKSSEGYLDSGLYFLCQKVRVQFFWGGGGEHFFLALRGYN